MKKIYFLIGMLAMILASCSNEAYDSPQIEEPIVPNERVDIVLNGATRATAESLRDFYVDFTADAVRYVDNDSERTEKNVVVSPLSASMMLGMLANGVDADCREKIMDYLGTNDLSNLNTLAGTLLAELPDADNQAALGLANSLWINQNYSLAKGFPTLMETSFEAEIRYDDFAGDGGAVRDRINSWCSSKTNGLIKDVVREVTSEQLMVMLNTLYFKGAWNGKPFDKSKTEKAVFHGLLSDRNVDMMCAAPAERNYAEDNDFEAFSLPFGNGAYTFLVILPKEGADASGSLPDARRVAELREKLRGSVIGIRIPKFKWNDELLLSKVFADGPLAVLNEKIRFTMFDPVEEFIPQVRQLTSFEVDESGAEGAAVTVTTSFTSGGAGSGETYEPHVVNVDRPFYFFINEISTGACVLSGRIADIN